MNWRSPRRRWPSCASVSPDYLVLAFDTACADAYGLIVAARERAGRPIAVIDAQIAAICAAYNAVLATRNIRDFLNTGIEIVDPWDQSATDH
jgi:predicted nucleic acid-binding protein